jgi:hypothetical protein
LLGVKIFVTLNIAQIRLCAHSAAHIRPVVTIMVTLALSNFPCALALNSLVPVALLRIMHNSNQ